MYLINLTGCLENFSKIEEYRKNRTVAKATVRFFLPNTSIISLINLNINSILKNKLIKIINKIVDNVKSIVYNIDKEKEIKGGFKYESTDNLYQTYQRLYA